MKWSGVIQWRLSGHSEWCCVAITEFSSSGYHKIMIGEVRIVMSQSAYPRMAV
jgi:hypothetical protein